MGSPIPNPIVFESGKDGELARYWETEMTHNASTASVLNKPMGPSGVDLDVRSIWITPGNKPATSASNTLDVWVGAPGSVSDVQTVTLTATGGNIQYGFAGAVTPLIAATATGATVQTAFLALPTVGAGNATVTGGAGGPYVFTFAGALANENMPLIQLYTGSLTGGSATIVHTTPGVGQRLMPQQLDANWTANTPVLTTPGAAPHKPARIPNGTQITVSMSFNGNDSATPVTLNVRLYIEVPYYDQAAKFNQQGTYIRAT